MIRHKYDLWWLNSESCCSMKSSFFQVCRWLVGRGADPHASTSEGNTVLMWAAWAGGLDVTRYMAFKICTTLASVKIWWFFSLFPSCVLGLPRRGNIYPVFWLVWRAKFQPNILFGHGDAWQGLEPGPFTSFPLYSMAYSARIRWMRWMRWMSWRLYRWAVEEARADLGAVNVNGCSVAHWAASGGDGAVCR